MLGFPNAWTSQTVGNQQGNELDGQQHKQTNMSVNSIPTSSNFPSSSTPAISGAGGKRPPSSHQVQDDSTKKKRRKRDPTLPKPARFAWNFYFRDQYTKIRNSEPSEHNNVQKAFTEIGYDLGKKWKSLSKEEKEPLKKLELAPLDVNCE